MKLVVGVGEFPPAPAGASEDRLAGEIEALEQGQGPVDGSQVDARFAGGDPTGDLFHGQVSVTGRQHLPDMPPRRGQAVALAPQDVADVGFIGHAIQLRTICKYDSVPGSGHRRTMHAPDGFLSAGTALATGALSAGTVGVALRQSKARLRDKHIPLAGLAAAFVFAAQMINFPVVAGTTGHLVGGALAAIVLGPAVGAVVVTIVVIIQALAFADGGITALGYNILNMAIVPAFGGFAVFRLIRRLLPAGGGSVIAATGLAAGASVVMAAAAFSIEWLFGATAPIAFDTVFGAMVSVHVLIGVGEAVISAMVIAAVLKARPDLVYGARDLRASQLAETRPSPIRVFLIAGLLITLFVAAIASQFAADGPDGLESVARAVGIAQGERAWLEPLFADYATAGISNAGVSLAVAGSVGVVITILVTAGLLHGVRRRGGIEI